MKKRIAIPNSTSISKQKNQSRHARFQALRWMSQRFPQAFNIENNIHALQLGMMQELLNYADEAEAAGISKAKLREALVIFTRRLDYLACLKAQGPRINLLGEVVGYVTVEEANMAAVKIKKWIEKCQKHQRRSKLSKDYDWDPVMAREPYSEQVKAQKPVEIVIKSKAAKTLDANAVNRLRLKLGLSSS
jgi:ProP effector